MSSPRYIAIEHEGIVEVHAYGGDPSALCGLDGNDPGISTRIVELPAGAKIDCLDCQTIWERWRRFAKRDFVDQAAVRLKRSAASNERAG